MNAWLAVSVLAMGAAVGEWPAFRGLGDSIAKSSDLPLEWSEESVAWRCSLPGYGQSSPVVWNGRAFVTSIEGEYKDVLLVSAVDVATGKLLWTKRFEGSQRVQDSDYVSKGAPTPVVDGEPRVRIFESGDLIALDHEGNEIWKRSLVKEYGEFKGNHGIGTSPALAKDAVVLLIDHDGPSYLLAVDRKSGANRWKVDRPSRVSWTSPTVVDHGDKEVIYLSSSGAAEG
ncbi:MAG: PQQ-binding-like beta-propeller repeat protein [Planctomycetota bacterium]